MHIKETEKWILFPGILNRQSLTPIGGWGARSRHSNIQGGVQRSTLKGRICEWLNCWWVLEDGVKARTQYKNEGGEKWGISAGSNVQFAYQLSYHRRAMGPFRL